MHRERIMTSIYTPGSSQDFPLEKRNMAGCVHEKMAETPRRDIMIKAGIIGSTGYAGNELVRLLLQHPEVEIVRYGSRSSAGNKSLTARLKC